MIFLVNSLVRKVGFWQNYVSKERFIIFYCKSLFFFYVGQIYSPLETFLLKLYGLKNSGNNFNVKYPIMHNFFSSNCAFDFWCIICPSIMFSRHTHWRLSMTLWKSVMSKLSTFKWFNSSLGDHLLSKSSFS